jgi:hypothetical protein
VKAELDIKVLQNQVRALKKHNSDLAQRAKEEAKEKVRMYMYMVDTERERNRGSLIVYIGRISIYSHSTLLAHYSKCRTRQLNPKITIHQ